MRVKINYIKILASAFVICTGYFVRAQPQFTTDDMGETIPYQTLLNLNPSFAGSNGLIRNQAAGKTGFTSPFMRRFDAWMWRPQRYYSFYNGFDAYLQSTGGSVGVSFNYYEIFGSMLNRDINLIYAQPIPLKNQNLKIVPSLQLGYLYRERQPVRDMFGTPQTSSLVTKSDMDVSAGLLVSLHGFYAGFSLFHLYQPEIDFFGNRKLGRRACFYTSYNLHATEKVLINFSWNCHVQAKQLQLLQLSSNIVLKKHLLFGWTLSSNGTPYANLGYKSYYFTAAFNYDLEGFGAFDGLNNWSVALSINLRNKENRKKLTDFETW